MQPDASTMTRALRNDMLSSTQPNCNRTYEA